MTGKAAFTFLLTIAVLISHTFAVDSYHKFFGCPVTTCPPVEGPSTCVSDGKDWVFMPYEHLSCIQMNCNAGVKQTLNSFCGSKNKWKHAESEVLNKNSEIAG